MGCADGDYSTTKYLFLNTEKPKRTTNKNSSK